MALTIRTTRMQREEEAMAMYTAKAKLWHTADRSEIVEDGHPDAAFLFLAAGEQIPEEQAVDLGLVKRASKPEDKKGEKPADKTGSKPENK